MGEISCDINLCNAIPEDIEFNSAIGHIEDIIMDDKFAKVYKNFLDKNWAEFGVTDEHKLIYGDIFQKYKEEVEKFIEDELVKKIQNFQMSTFENELLARQNEVEGEIFELLYTMIDFSCFKMMFQDYKDMMNGVAVDFSQDLVVTKCSVPAST